jgi:large subunit ribosomal protein L5
VANQENNPQGAPETPENQGNQDNRKARSQGQGQQKENKGNRPQGQQAQGNQQARPAQGDQAQARQQQPQAQGNQPQPAANGRTNGRPKGHAEASYVPRLKARYQQEVVPALTKQFSYTNPMQVPHIEKVVINIGMGSEARENAKSLDNAVGDVGQITGQKAVITRAKKSIASFKLRTGMPIGVMVTLRGSRMYDFLDRLVNIALARVRDFNGINPGSFDGHGNYSLGLKEQLIFPEIDYDKIDRIRGMEVVIVTSANTDEEGRALLQGLGMPFRRS